MDSIGAYLRRERELRHVSLEELVQITRVPLRMLQRIEEDRFDELPGEVFARGFLRVLRARPRPRRDRRARALRRRTQGGGAGAAAALWPRCRPPERGRRFGIAIALVILVILFTLALSIVFNARQRNTPLELSPHARQRARCRPTSAGGHVARLSSAERA